MDSKELFEKFVGSIKTLFQDVSIKPPTEHRPNRISLYVSNKKKDKRWMQIEWNPEILSVAMDHMEGDLSENDVRASGVSYGDFNGKNTRIILHNNNAVFLTVFTNEPINFDDHKLIEFLKNHFNSYLKRVNRYDLIQ